MINLIKGKVAAWRAYRDAMFELSQLKEHELQDLGLTRADIPFVARSRALIGEPASRFNECDSESRIPEKTATH